MGGGGGGCRWVLYNLKERTSKYYFHVKYLAICLSTLLEHIQDSSVQRSFINVFEQKAIEQT